MGKSIIRGRVEAGVIKGLWEGGWAASASENAATLRLSFSPHWDGLAKTAYFTDAKGAASVAVELLESGVDDGGVFWDVDVPAEAARWPGEASFTVEGREVEGERVTRILTTAKKTLPIPDSGVPEQADNAGEITATDKDQVFAKIESWLETERAREGAEAQRQAAETAREGAEAQRQSAEQAREDAERGYIAQAEAAADRAQAEADRASIPAVAGVYNVVLEDRVTGTRFALIVESGVLRLMEVSSALDAAELTLIDRDGGTAFGLTVESGVLKLEEV